MDKDPTLEKMEEQCLWAETIDYLNIRWKNDPCLDSLLRVFSQAWFLMSYIEQLSPYRKNRGSIELPAQWPDVWLRLLKEANTAGKKEYGKDPVFLAVSGHMMVVHPEWFVNKYCSYKEAFQEGSNRLIAAQNEMPELRIFSADEKRKPVDGVLKEQLFPGNSEVDTYFKSLVMGW